MSEPESRTKSSTLLPPKVGGGPHGIGDPDDKYLRKVELDILIPQKMRDLSRAEKCFKEVEDFTQCCKEYSLLMVVKCRAENNILKECLTKWYNDEGFKEHCKNLYLEERSEYRRTGIPKKRRGESTRIGSNM